MEGRELVWTGLGFGWGWEGFVHTQSHADRQAGRQVRVRALPPSLPCCSRVHHFVRRVPPIAAPPSATVTWEDFFFVWETTLVTDYWGWWGWEATLESIVRVGEQLCCTTHQNILPSQPH